LGEYTSPCKIFSGNLKKISNNIKNDSFVGLCRPPTPRAFHVGLAFRATIRSTHYTVYAAAQVA
jgi:hypothetical protein